jgi:hypothetical protein
VRHKRYEQPESHVGYRPRCDERHNQHDLKCGVRGDPEALAGDSAARRLNEIWPTRPEWIDHTEFV